MFKPATDLIELYRELFAQDSTKKDVKFGKFEELSNQIAGYWTFPKANPQKKVLKKPSSPIVEIHEEVSTDEKKEIFVEVPKP
jgi:hypothetical protein